MSVQCDRIQLLSVFQFRVSFFLLQISPFAHPFSAQYSNICYSDRAIKGFLLLGKENTMCVQSKLKDYWNDSWVGFVIGKQESESSNTFNLLADFLKKAHRLVSTWSCVGLLAGEKPWRQPHRSPPAQPPPRPAIVFMCRQEHHNESYLDVVRGNLQADPWSPLKHLHVKQQLWKMRSICLYVGYSEVSLKMLSRQGKESMKSAENIRTSL